MVVIRFIFIPVYYNIQNYMKKMYNIATGAY